MNLRQIEAFRAIMITGSATKAAQILYISQPAISRLISTLEYRTNIKLFNRKPNRLEPTPEAKNLYQCVKRAFVGLEEIQATAIAIANNQQGSLRIGAVPVCNDSFMPELVARFQATHSNISITLESAARTTILDLLRSQYLDIGIIPISVPNDNLRVYPFCQHKAVCILPRHHRLGKQPTIQLEDLKYEKFITLPFDSPFLMDIDLAFKKKGVQKKVAIEARSQRTICKLVGFGAGVAVVDPFAVEKDDKNIVVKPFSPTIQWQFAAIESNISASPVISQVFIQFLRQDFAVPHSCDSIPPDTSLK